MSLLLNICGVIVSVQQFPDQALQQIYQQEYHCPIVQIDKNQASSNTDVHVPAQEIPVQAADQINRYFPAENAWWPLYSLDQVKSNSFKQMIARGIYPGVILPQENFTWGQYKNAKYAVLQGAIPVIEYKHTDPHYFASKAIFATALGMRPMAAYIPAGWDPNILMQPKGSYIIQHFSNAQLPMPARASKLNDLTFYNATTNTQTASGMQIIVNPPDSLPIENIRYPDFGIAWQFHGIPFQSNEHGIQTGIMGYALLVLSVLNIPIDLILNTHYPNILTTMGSSISWVSLVLGVILFLVLIISIVKRVRDNGSD
ncbi:hypothetical protein B9T33_14295 [Acinetobacter sp. ANC 5054]|uniref:hypothetical protein n=1 Tax=Acinetobacter sp. ANC 5054 TaxID=1977877 RepID=UPI000A33F90F|nr:hypothetical protein [Acinetobacter sp. ANC 5054]OTG78483.1 hypothetical protein B9T33_14295 [Acinetobacter sp. ANC 5054]